MSASFGCAYDMLTRGCQYDAIHDYIGPVIIASNGVNIGDNDIRVQNSVMYMIPDYYGLKPTVQYGFSNATGFANNNACSLGIGYEHGPPRWSAVYVQYNHPYMLNGIDGAWIDEATKAAGARRCRRSTTSWRRRSRRAERMIDCHGSSL
ncbi:hypothetical protein WM16_11630 [Burkholderia ubonensis]|uniref:Porin n=1 Tax=Burkholderia ubonensis TaxID=101571 RepID=A0A108CL73_9BURK|nr:hypothetical protein [Burkholderia ubonensis]KWK76694.1 hypothetical protein WM16_11630 [Burkholderia ubonensis]